MSLKSNSEAIVIREYQHLFVFCHFYHIMGALKVIRFHSNVFSNKAV